jgi:hypothetical protein
MKSRTPDLTSMLVCRLDLAVTGDAGCMDQQREHQQFSDFRGVSNFCLFCAGPSASELNN